MDWLNDVLYRYTLEYPNRRCRRAKTDAQYNYHYRTSWERVQKYFSEPIVQGQLCIVMSNSWSREQVFHESPV